MENLEGKIVIVPSGEFGTIHVEDLIDELEGVVSVRFLGGHPAEETRYYHVDDLRFYNSDAGIVALNPLREELEKTRAENKQWQERLGLLVAVVSGLTARKLEAMGLPKESASGLFHEVLEEVNRLATPKQEDSNG